MKIFYFDKINSRNFFLAIYIGLIAGIISALVKSGFETIIPPRTLETTPPPIVLLEKLNLNTNSMTFEWLGQSINWGGNVVHILFSIVIAIIYCFVIKVVPKLKIIHGVFFGVLVSIFAHGLVVPLLGLSGWLWTAGFQAMFSEFIGTAFWIWTIECVRRDLEQKRTVL